MVNTKLFFPFISLAASAAVERRQVDGQVYCEGGAQPNTNDCVSAANLIGRGGSYDAVAEFWYGNCRIDAAQPITQTGVISGEDYYSSVTAVINQCQSNGYVYRNGMRVQVGLCIIGQSGVQTECRSPGQGPMKKRDVEAEAVEFVNREAEAEAAAEALDLLKRQDSPAPGITCGIGPAVDVNNCLGAADQLDRAEYHTLPFRQVVNGCDIAFELKRPTGGVFGDQIASRIRNAVNLCQSGGYIGIVTDTNNGDYDAYIGKICSRFSYGYASCTP